MAEIDREKVIKGLETIKQFFEYGLPSTAEMFDSYYGILNDAISMLKEQEAQIKTRDESLEKAREEIKWLRGMLKEQEKVEGHWIPIESPTGVEAFGIKEMTVQFVRCSVCDAEEDVSFAAYRFCPRCGAKMEGR